MGRFQDSSANGFIQDNFMYHPTETSFQLFFHFVLSITFSALWSFKSLADLPYVLGYLVIWSSEVLFWHDYLMVLNNR